MKHARRILGVLLTLAMLFTSLSVGFMSFAADYKTGDVIKYGTYPQSEVKDTKLMGKLADVEKHWRSAEYYSGTGSMDDGKMTASDYMQLSDFIYDGQAYRAVLFTKYRPTHSGAVASPTSGNGSGYATDFIYYFKYEPIEWIVLDAGSKLLMSKNLLDAQAYQNLVKKSGSEYKSGNNKANDYKNSSLRAYLNGSFYTFAFSQAQKANIAATSYSYATYGSAAATPAVTDKVTVLSYNDCKNTAYGFNDTINADAALVATGITDYARSQAITVINGRADWWLRTPDTSSGGASCVGTTGALSHAASVNFTDKGVRPVITLSALKADTTVSLLDCKHEHGTEPVQAVAVTCEKDGCTAYEICKDCSAIIGEKRIIPAPGHVDKKMRSGEDGSDGWCDVCGEELTIHLDNSGKVQISGPLQSVFDLIRKLVAKIESLFGMLSDDKKDGESAGSTGTDTSNTGDESADLSGAGSALDSFADMLGTLVDSFRNLSDKKSAEKEEDRNSFINFLQNYGKEETTETSGNN